MSSVVVRPSSGPSRQTRKSWERLMDIYPAQVPNAVAQARTGTAPLAHPFR